MREVVTGRPAGSFLDVALAVALGGDCLAEPGCCGPSRVCSGDGVLVLAHSEKQHAAATWKKTFGTPLFTFVDHGREDVAQRPP
ncbi:hypothetical protein OH735_22410 [Streptomyces sp. NBC_01618]|nr:hypothetical protein OH735_22410 [Streptomyces sp. NBC_01618]